MMVIGCVCMCVCVCVGGGGKIPSPHLSNGICKHKGRMSATDALKPALPRIHAVLCLCSSVFTQCRLHAVFDRVDASQMQCLTEIRMWVTVTPERKTPAMKTLQRL